MSNILPGWKKPRNAIAVLVDRSVDHRFAGELRNISGLYAKSLAEMYGDEEAQQLSDAEFLQEAGEHGWVVWTQNPRMWLVNTEREAIQCSGTKVFTMGSARHTTTGKGFVFGRRFLAIQRRMLREGACFWRIYMDRPTIKDLK